MGLFDPGPQGFGKGADRVDQYTPFGNMVFSDKDRRVATTTLSPALQALLDQQMQSQQLLGQRAQGMIGALPGAGQQVFGGNVGQFQGPGGGVGQFQAPQFGPGAQTGTGNPLNLLNMLRGNTDFSAERDEVEKAQFDRLMGLMGPQFARQEEAMQQRLANQGLPQASRAYSAETGRFDDTRNRATEQAAMQAILAGGAEQSRLLQDLIGTSQAGMGQALANRGQRFGEALQGFGANLSGREQRFGEALQGFGANLQGNQQNFQQALANRQIPFNELMALMQGGQVQMPQFQQQPGANIGGAMMGQQNAQAQGNFINSLLGGLLGAGGSIGAGFLAGR